jgi:hypothetical protein
MKKKSRNKKKDYFVNNIKTVHYLHSKLVSSMGSSVDHIEGRYGQHQTLVASKVSNVLYKRQINVRNNLSGSILS